MPEELIDIMHVPVVSNASHDVSAYRFNSNDGTIHEGRTTTENKIPY